ncbi:hypothetical protein HMSSN139_65040 [Paenibacillus sp. HMSSN-139]|nr:hypothetical protein HMSSN139_65040 [Paenibacillus sp. HMSSN-139]
MHLRKMSELNIGLIGTGSISEAHLQAYRANPRAKLLAICDVNEERARNMAGKYDIPHVYTDYREMFANPEVHAVSICTWNNTHAAISIAALKAGKQVLCENRCASPWTRPFRCSRRWNGPATCCKSGMCAGTPPISRC